jgi:hypothetical protein
MAPSTPFLSICIPFIPAPLELVAAVVVPVTLLVEVPVAEPEVVEEEVEPVFDKAVSMESEEP